MHKSFLLLFCVCFSLQLLAQQSRIDSLSRVLEKTEDKDQKGSLLIFRSKATTPISIEKARTDAQEALSYYQQTGNVEGQIDAYLQFSGLYSREAKYKLALDVDSVTYDLSKKLQYKKGLAISLSNMGRNLQQVGDMKKAKKALLESNAMFISAGMERETAEIKNRLGILYRRMGEFKASLKSFDEGLVIAHKYNLTNALANIHMNKANTLDESGAYDEAIRNHLESIKLKEKMKDERGLAQSYNNLANVYTHTGQYKEALGYYQQTRIINENQKQQNKTSLALAYNNLANGYSALNQYDSVLYFHNKALALFTETGEKPGMAMVYHDLGNYYFEQQDYTTSMDYLNKALNIQAGSLLRTDEASTRNIMGVVLGKMNRHKEAEQQLLKALTLVKDTNTRLQESIYKSLASHYNVIGDFEKANDYQSRYFNIKDNLLTESEAINMVKEKGNYDLEKKEIALQLSEQQKKVDKLSINNRNKTIWLLIVSLGMLGILTFVFAYNIHQRKISAAELSRKNQRIETLVRELHHRVKNNLQVVSGLLALQSNRLEDDNARQAMDAGRSRVDAMALIHQKLYMDKDLASVDIKVYLENLSSSLAHSFGYSEQTVSTMVNLNHDNMDVDRAIPIGLIVNELVTNSFKHAFDDTENPEIKVLLVHKKANVLELEIADNGKGYSGKEDMSSSFGMKLVHTLVEQLNANLVTENINGTSYKILINTIS